MKLYGKSQSTLAWGVIFFLGVIFIIIILTSIIWLYLLSKRDLKYGKECFVVITGVDRADPSKVLLDGIVGLETTGSPGSLGINVAPTRLQFPTRLREGKQRAEFKPLPYGSPLSSAILSTDVPGAVFIVGVSQGVTIGRKRFAFRQIFLLNSKYEYVLAPPGLELTVPGNMEILGKMLKAGHKIKVPKDSRLP